MVNSRRDSLLRRKVFAAVRAYCDFRHGPRPFVPGTTYIPPSGKVFDSSELVALTDTALDFWLTADRYAKDFEQRLASRLAAKRVLLVNSGSSANLLAVAALGDRSLGEKRLKPGDEVITTAACFPTTLAPLVQQGLVPVLVDSHIPTYNATPEAVEAAISKKTKAVILAHTLGNPFAADAVARLAARKGLWLIEDCCDALGARCAGRPVSSFGELSTFSFYPAHHITMGEGGAVAANSPRMGRIVESLRDWGRDCWCAPGSDDTCRKRFSWKLGDLPFGYDHKYIYSRLGFNLKLTEMQAAVGVAQLGKLDGFLRARARNFAALRKGLARFEEFLVLPESLANAQPSWFGLPLTLREGVPFERRDLISFVEGRLIGTRLLFAGNIARQPCMAGVRYRQAGKLENSDRIMRDTFWIGVHPGITPAIIAYMLEQFAAYFRSL
jgi:CDP-6-deoxy-D-xylo-4-hexulose-3-dehydrase